MTLQKSQLPLLIFLQFFIYLGILGGPQAFAKKRELIDEVFSKYKVAKLIKLEVKKTVKSDLLAQDKIIDGKIFISQNLFRWDTENPDKSQLLFDGKIIWSTQFPPKEFKSNPNVAKRKLDKEGRKQLLVSTLLNQEPLTKNFKIISQEQKDGEVAVTLEPKVKDASIQKLIVKIEKKKKEISSISYVDDIGNLTAIDISRTQLLRHPDAKLFKFKMPEGAIVTNL